MGKTASDPTRIGPERDSFLTTMMAMRPPTSPTTVMGGFSLGINTGSYKERMKDFICADSRTE